MADAAQHGDEHRLRLGPAAGPGENDERQVVVGAEQGVSHPDRRRGDGQDRELGDVRAGPPLPTAERAYYELTTSITTLRSGSSRPVASRPSDTLRHSHPARFRLLRSSRRIGHRMRAARPSRRAWGVGQPATATPHAHPEAYDPRAPTGLCPHAPSPDISPGFVARAARCRAQWGFRPEGRGGDPPGRGGSAGGGGGSVMGGGGKLDSTSSTPR